VPLKDCDCDWPTVCIADQPKDHLALAFFAVTGVPNLGSGTRMPLAVGRRESVQGQGPLTQVTFGSGRFQLRLAAP
jgi:hypothetical protein